MDLRHVKTTLSMEMLRGKTPAMVRKEIYVQMIAYNLLRTLMWEAGKRAGVSPLRVSMHRDSSAFGEFHLQGAQTQGSNSAQGSILLCWRW